MAELPGSPTIHKSLQYTEFLPSISLAYDVSNDVMLYGKVSKGFLTEGLTPICKNKKDFTYDPEYSWNYEAGIKSAFLDNSLLVNLSGFYIDITDKQVVQFITPSQRKIVNAAQARSYGIELEADYKPLEELTLSASAGYLDSR